MKALMLLTGNGPLVILTSYKDEDQRLLDKLAIKGIEKFVSYEIPMELAEQRYGGHFQTVMHDLRESDDLRVLDYNGDRAFNLFRFDEMGPPHIHEPARAAAA